MSKEVVEVGLETKAALKQAKELEDNLTKAGKSIGEGVASGLAVAMATGGPLATFNTVASRAALDTARQGAEAAGGKIGGFAGAAAGSIFGPGGAAAGRAAGGAIGGALARLGVETTLGRHQLLLEMTQGRVEGFASQLAAGGVQLSREELDQLSMLALPQQYQIMQAQLQSRRASHSVPMQMAALRLMMGDTAIQADSAMGR